MRPNTFRDAGIALTSTAWGLGRSIGRLADVRPPRTAHAQANVLGAIDLLMPAERTPPPVDAMDAWGPSLRPAGVTPDLGKGEEHDVLEVRRLLLEAITVEHVATRPPAGDPTKF